MLHRALCAVSNVSGQETAYHVTFAGPIDAPCTVVKTYGVPTYCMGSICLMHLARLKSFCMLIRSANIEL